MGITYSYIRQNDTLRKRDYKTRTPLGTTSPLSFVCVCVCVRVVLFFICLNSHSCIYLSIFTKNLLHIFNSIYYTMQ